MTWIANNIRWIMIVSGVLTATMIYAAIAPDAALRSMFGETVDGPLAHILARNWGALIALVGAMLIYGAFDPPGRPFILIVAGISTALSMLFGTLCAYSIARFRTGGDNLAMWIISQTAAHVMWSSDTGAAPDARAVPMAMC